MSVRSDLSGCDRDDWRRCDMVGDADVTGFDGTDETEVNDADVTAVDGADVTAVDGAVVSYATLSATD